MALHQPGRMMPDSGGLTVGQRIGNLETAVISNSNRIDALESWRDELHGAMGLVKFTLGTSIVTGMLAITSLILLLNGQVR
jgi:hypothetical protein